MAEQPPSRPESWWPECQADASVEATEHPLSSCVAEVPSVLCAWAREHSEEPGCSLERGPGQEGLQCGAPGHTVGSSLAKGLEDPALCSSPEESRLQEPGSSVRFCLLADSSAHELSLGRLFLSWAPQCDFLRAPVPDTWPGTSWWLHAQLKLMGQPGGQRLCGAGCRMAQWTAFAGCLAQEAAATRTDSGKSDGPTAPQCGNCLSSATAVEATAASGLQLPGRVAATLLNSPWPRLAWLRPLVWKAPGGSVCRRGVPLACPPAAFGVQPEKLLSCSCCPADLFWPHQSLRSQTLLAQRGFSLPTGTHVGCRGAGSLEPGETAPERVATPRLPQGTCQGGFRSSAAGSPPLTLHHRGMTAGTVGVHYRDHELLESISSSCRSGCYGEVYSCAQDDSGAAGMDVPVLGVGDRRPAATLPQPGPSPQPGPLPPDTSFPGTGRRLRPTEG
ncbi:PREDICTED: uncharacterized protein LOC102005406 [Chinchilla lanigera]|uniref:uncharacterized protein LOC102005406 n=1 Tax=Chinchilla lanigera TaxID=34839 RepID=UPI00069872CD|nr:PREDICTED: uncharacterized protein LOC102005406 [Chinchilla lanigera]